MDELKINLFLQKEMFHFSTISSIFHWKGGLEHKLIFYFSESFFYFFTIKPHIGPAFSTIFPKYLWFLMKNQQLNVRFLPK